MPVFDVERDKVLINAGTHFLCVTHQIALPIEQQSPDNRYCLTCYNFLLEEAKLIPDNRNKHPEWLPVMPR